MFSCTDSSSLLLTPDTSSHTTNDGLVVQDGISLVDGRLKFDNGVVLHNYIAKLRDDGVDAALVKHRNVGFISHFDVMNMDFHDYTKYDSFIQFYDQSNTSLNGKLDDRIAGQYLEIPDDYLSSTLSVNKEVQIGDTVYKVERDYLFAYKVGKLNEIEKFKAAAQKGETYSSSHFNVYPLTIEQYQKDNTGSNSVLVYSNRPSNFLWGGAWLVGFGWRVEGTGWEYYRYNGNFRHKFMVEQSEVNLFFYASHDVRAYTKKEESVEHRFLWWTWRDWRESWDRVSYIQATSTNMSIALQDPLPVFVPSPQPMSILLDGTRGTSTVAFGVLTSTATGVRTINFTDFNSTQSNTFDFPLHEALGLGPNFVVGIGVSISGTPSINLSLNAVLNGRLLQGIRISGVSGTPTSISGNIKYAVLDASERKLTNREHNITLGRW